jgi:site-specific recombinase XerD
VGWVLAILTAGLVEEFVAERRDAGYAHMVSSRALTALLEHLRGLRVVPVPVAAPAALIEVLLGEYRRALINGRGLVASTAGRYVNLARKFLVDAAGGNRLDLGRLSAGDVSGFVVREARRLSVGSTKDVVNCLRSFLRFLDSQGLVEGDLVSAVPAVASCRGASLPRALSAEQVAALFTERLIGQRQVSPNTVAAYRDAWRLLLGYANRSTGTEPCALDLADLDATLISGFLDHLEAERHNTARTRNARLAAIRSFFRFAALRHPEHQGLIARVLAIPTKRFAKPEIPGSGGLPGGRAPLPPIPRNRRASWKPGRHGHEPESDGDPRQ